ncbi:MAM and LDL-receptor class A domain-containing protein 1-like [Lytechinus variegatus]|uniref:MAM and LDL-receptor class A domain-containing protein 1-like n=1 Tax=Lytechinus variegatus TaxID=7654 RepID=UPI001BB16740|nr:MAM and LDL-receptor class A domain-containing protein 1-like [Lytechinus variegatus]
MLEGQQSQSSTEWKQASVPVNFNQVDDLFLVAVLGSTSYSNIAVDDLNILNGNCNLNPASALPGSTNSLLDCNFEKTFCYWNQDPTDDYQWTLWTKATGTNETGPSSDPNSETGWYVYAEADMVLPGSKARLLSPLEHESADYTETCLEFYYHMFGADMGNLYVYIERTDLNETEIIFKRGGSDQGNSWYVAQVNIGIEPGVGFYRLIFEAVRGGSIYSDIAIDEIKYHNGTCPPLKTCGFESNLMCGWKNEILYDMFDWSRNTASSLRPDLGDHTNGVPSGYLIYANQGIPRVPGDYATLLSPTYSATATGDCFSFWYHIHGDSDVGRLRVYERIDGNLEGPYWSSTGVNEGDNWWKASVTLKSKSSFQIAVVGDVGNDPNSELAIDDFKVEEQPCAPRGSCDFEKDYCTWLNAVTGDDDDWVRLNGATTGGGTGPVKDHTLGAMLGSFLYTDSVVIAAGEKAWLLSEVYQAGDACFSFWIHMNGPGNKTLNLYTEDQSNYVKDLTWTRSGNLSDHWVQGLVSLSNPDVYRIIIEAVYDDDNDGSIALDDTMLAEGGLCTESSVANCDFEDDMCGYEQADDDDFDWTRNQGRTPSDNTGPTYDHTTMTSEGWYMYMESSSPYLQGMETRLMSQIIDLTTRLCLHFWYHMFGRDVGTLNVLTLRESAKPPDIGSVVWTRSGQVGDQWMAGTLVVGEPESFRLVFQGVVSGYEGDIAIDDISMYSGDCQRTLSCEFEDPQICGYVQDSITDDFDWTFWSGDTPTSYTGPSVDVTYGTSFGHYMYTELSGRHSVGASAKLLSPHVSMETTQTVCWRYYYHMFGRDAGAFTVAYRNKDFAQITVAQYFGSQGNEWIEGQVEVTENGYEMMFIGTYYNGDEGDIALDSVSMTPGRCIDCDFESSWCGWVHSNGDDFDWVRWRGEAATPSTGPSYDHTKQNEAGYYLLFDTSDPRKLGEVAHVSNVFETTDDEMSCFTFWFHMFGNDVSELELIRAPIETGIVEFVWRLRGQQSMDRTNWIQGQIPFKGSNMLAFTGTVGPGIYGDIALDDFLFVPGDCVVLPREADLLPPTTSLPPTTTTPAPNPYSCDFELNFCTYIQSLDDDMNWTRQKGRTSSYDTGPSQDHTTGQGAYIYTEATNKAPGTIAHLESTSIPASSMPTVCIDFWYHMYGSNMGTLNIKPKIGDDLKGALWTRSGDHSDRWLHGQVNYQSSQDFQIVFEGVLGEDYYSDMALDDVTIYSGNCQGVHECTFESEDLCGYVQLNSDNFDWSWGTGSTQTPYTGPALDVTTGTSTGHYLYIDASEQTSGDMARIMTPDLDPSDGKTELCWSFYYHMFGDNIGQLNIYIDGDDTPIWSLGGTNLGDVWFYDVFNITKFVTYKLIFEGVVGQGSAGDIAIDEIDYKKGSCEPRGACDFENGMCAWQNIPGDDFDWLRNQGSTTDSGTGPNVDHTTNTVDGFYVYTESSYPQGSGDEAFLFLGVPDLTGLHCLQFWYHMIGNGMGELLVYTSNSSILVVTGNDLWRMVGSQSPSSYEWLYGQVTIDFDYASQLG